MQPCQQPKRLKPDLQAKAAHNNSPAQRNSQGGVHLLFKTDADAKSGQAVAQHYAALSTAIVNDVHAVRG
jgi:hypothetical protein